LEHALANLHQKEAALVFQSCYVANDATISTVMDFFPNPIQVFSDEYNHALLYTNTIMSKNWKNY
jgi:5-aminolevulinate synthase